MLTRRSHPNPSGHTIAACPPIERSTSGDARSCRWSPIQSSRVTREGGGMSEQERRRESTARSRRLGSELREKRLAAGWQSGLLAAELGWSLGKVSKLETGVRGATDTDVAAYLA